MNWQAYLDGTLGIEERMEAERLLRTDPRARQELDGLKRFVSQVSAAARMEMVHAQRFELFIPRRTPQHVFRRSLFALVPVAVFALSWRYFGHDTARLDRTPVEEVTRMNDPKQAADWATTKLGTGVPTVTLSGKARLCVARRGDGWTAFDYHVGRDRYSLFVSRDPTPLRGKPTIDIATNKFVTSDGVGWEQKGLAFYVTGPRPEMRISLACAASAEISKQTLVTPAPVGGHCGVPQ